MKHILALLVATSLLLACNENDNKIILVKKAVSLQKRVVATEYRIFLEKGKHVKCYSRLASKIKKVYSLKDGQLLDLVPSSATIRYNNSIWLHVSPRGYTDTCYIETKFLVPLSNYQAQRR
ncbi:MAG: hypothetical protein KAH22_07820 [Thiotrichaceae bacterium]|nr:hypothetical protein [Thiotrichaceae bacterium]